MSAKSRDLFGYATDRTDETWFNCTADTREEAAAYAFEQEPAAEKVYICNQIASDKAHILPELVDDLLEQAEEACTEDEQLGHHEDDAFDHSWDSKVALECALKAWLTAFPGPRIWTTIGSEITEHVKALAARPVEE